MVTIDCREAIARLRAVKAPFVITDAGIAIHLESGFCRFARHRVILWQDSLGSLVSRDAVNAEAVFWQNKNQNR